MRRKGIRIDMRNVDMLEIKRTKETDKIARMPENTRKIVKDFLNEGL